MKKSSRKTTSRRGSKIPKNVLQTLSDTPSYKGQQRFKVWVPVTGSMLSTTVTTGVIADSFQVKAANVPNFATRFGGTFDEYRILAVRAKVRPVSATSGVSVFYFDEKVTSNATLADAQQRVGERVPNTNAQAHAYHQLNWRARDLLDLEYTAVGTTSTCPVSFKCYTDTTNFGAPATVTATWLEELEICFEFRGLKST